ncbi:hypothetical protein J4481_02525 [Candidatus Pacearchaeota archaeon]|nr:hypothetical protein [Candidatus Pacearchaeota archaeon]
MKEYEEEVDVEVTEIFLNEDEINEWISKLEWLRENKESVQLELDGDSDLLINYEESEEEDEE